MMSVSSCIALSDVARNSAISDGNTDAMNLQARIAALNEESKCLIEERWRLVAEAQQHLLEHRRQMIEYQRIREEMLHLRESFRLLIKPSVRKF